jgi:hypothetical protein
MLREINLVSCFYIDIIDNATLRKIQRAELAYKETSES